jgi:hypothetical protein
MSRAKHTKNIVYSLSLIDTRSFMATVHVYPILSFVSMGTKAINFDTYLYSSVQGTLESITAILRSGRINDAYALLRKYHDSALINIYASLYLRDHFSIDNFVVEQIDNWLQARRNLQNTVFYPST